MQFATEITQAYLDGTKNLEQLMTGVVNFRHSWLLFLIKSIRLEQRLILGKLFTNEIELAIF